MFELFFQRITEIDHQEVDAVDVADEVVVKEVVAGVAGKLPDADVPHGPDGSLVNFDAFGVLLMDNLRLFLLI